MDENERQEKKPKNWKKIVLYSLGIWLVLFIGVYFLWEGVIKDKLGELVWNILTGPIVQ